MPRIVLFDADVISHFIVNDKLSLLPSICLPHQMVILEAVYIEVILKSKNREILDKFMGDYSFNVTLFPSSNIDMNMEFARIKRNTPLIGDGERALMAHAKFNGDIIASSNFSDVADYCALNGIDYLGTLDLLKIAERKRFLNISDCNEFIKVARLLNNARFPAHVSSITDYHCQKLTMFD